MHHNNCSNIASAATVGLLISAYSKKGTCFFLCWNLSIYIKLRSSLRFSFLSFFFSLIFPDEIFYSLWVVSVPAPPCPWPCPWVRPLEHLFKMRRCFIFCPRSSMWTFLDDHIKTIVIVSASGSSAEKKMYLMQMKDAGQTSGRLIF